jgi:N-carbamoylputrescine amidase
MDGVRSAAQQGAQLVVLQELHATHYFCQQESAENFKYAETIPGPSSDKFAQLAAELDIVIVASLFERRTAGIYHNTAVVLDGQRGIVGTYRKMHIPDDPDYYEKYYFTPGDYEFGQQGFKPIDTSVGRLGVLVCWDQWFPEAARLMALAGAELLLFPTAIGWDKHDNESEQNKQRDAWVTVQRSHAIANGLPIAACNRTGFEPTNLQTPASDTDKNSAAENKGIQFWGSSFVAGPQGEILAQAAADDETILIAKIDLSQSESIRQAWPYLRDRRIDAYAELLKRYRE